MLDRDDAGRVVRNFGWMLSGSWVSYALSALTLFVVPRFLGSSQYGVMTSALAVAGLFGALRLAGFDKALIRDVAADREVAAREYSKVRYLKFGGSTLAAAAVLVAGALLSDTVPEYVCVAILSVLNFTQAFTSLNLAIVQAYEAMRIVPIVNFARQVSYLAVVVPVLWLVPEARGAVFTCSALLGSYVVGAVVARSFRRRFIDTPVRVGIRDLDRPFVVSGLLFSSSALFVYLYTRVDILFIDAFLTKADVGHYGLAVSVMDKAQGPFMLLTTAMFPALVRRHRLSGTRPQDVVRTAFAFFGVSSIMAVAVWLLAPFGVAVLAGKDFSSSTAVVRALALGFPFSMALYPFAQALQAMRREDLTVKLAPIRSVINIAIDIAVLAAGFGVVAVAWGTVVTNLLYGVVYALFALRAISSQGSPQ